MATEINAPVILICGGSASSASVQAAATMVAGQGAVPMIVTNHSARVSGKDSAGVVAEAQRLLMKADGILIMGNNGDIDPSEFGQNKHPKTTSETDTPEGKARRDLETMLMRIASTAGMPMLGICGGMQRMNVLCGGDLHQHVPDAMRDPQHSEHAQNELGIPPFVPVQPVTIAHGSTLGAIAGEISTIFTPARTIEKDIRLDVNSMHHQCVGKLGNGLRVAATGDDILRDGSKIVEAIEIDPHGPLAQGIRGNKSFGVFTQWHPEFSDNPLGAKITKHFTEAAREFSKMTGHKHTLEEVQEENRLSALSVMKERTPETTFRAGSMTARILQERESRSASPSLSA